MKKIKGLVKAYLLTFIAASFFALPQSVCAVELDEEFNATEPQISIVETSHQQEIVISDATLTIATEQATVASTEVSIQSPAPMPIDEQSTLLPVQGLTYGDVTQNSITINWDKDDDVTGYIIYRMDRNTNGKYVRRTMIKDNQTTSYTETDLISGRSYYYQVKTYLYENRTYYYSDPVIIKLATPPDTVQDLTLTTQEENKLSIEWNRVDGADGYIIYRMDYKTNSQYKKLATVNSNVTKINNTSLEAGRAYYYRICAYKEVAGIQYIGDYQTLKTATLPATVTNLKVTAQYTAQISISWDKSIGANGYIIYRMDSSTNGQYKRCATVEGNSNVKYTDNNLLAGRAYYYQVIPYKTVDGKTAYGNVATLKTGTQTLAPIFKTKSNNKKITASWSKVSGAEGYTIYIAEIENGTYYSQGSTTTTSFTSKQLQPGKTYYVRVAAFNLIDNKRIYSGYQTKPIACKNIAEGYNLGDTYIEVSISDQHLWFYKNDKCIVSTPVITGTKYKYDTPKGVFKVLEKESPARLVSSSWDIYVNYWLGVTNTGIGIHDSAWRTGRYGGNIYTYDGSDGSIYTPYSQVKKLYDNCPINTPIVIY